MSKQPFDITWSVAQTDDMADTRVFPLRIRNERLRELTRELAAGLGISQNEFIEQALERDVVGRGAMLADDLRAAADRIAALTEEQYQRILDRGAERFAASEDRPDPVQAVQIAPDAVREPPAVSMGVPAFRRAGRAAPA
jgi:hypothetical protein